MKLHELTFRFNTADGMTDEQYEAVARDIERYMRNAAWSCRDEVGEQQDCDLDFEIDGEME